MSKCLSDQIARRFNALSLPPEIQDQPPEYWQDFFEGRKALLVVDFPDNSIAVRFMPSMYLE